MWITSITIALVSCCIGSLLGPFPVGLDKNVNGMRRLVTQQIYLKNLPSIKSGSVGQQIRTIPKNSISIKVRCLGPPELVLSHMLAYKWFTKGRFVQRPHLTKMSISNNTWVLPLNIYMHICDYICKKEIERGMQRA